MNHIAQVHIKADAMGNGVVEVDGQDIATKIDGVQVTMQAHDLTRVMLLTTAGVDLELDAEVVVNPLEDVCDWLQSIDPDALEQLALDKPDLQTGSAFIASIQELWRGQH